MQVIGHDLWAVATLHLSPVCGRPEQYAVSVKHQDALGLTYYDQAGLDRMHAGPSLRWFKKTRCGRLEDSLRTQDLAGSLEQDLRIGWVRNSK